MTDDAHVPAAERELGAHFVGLLVGEEAQHHHRALALGQRFDAPGEPLALERGRLRGLEGRVRIAPGLEQRLAPPRPAPQLEHRHAAAAEHERGDPLRLAHLPGAQALERHEEHLLDEVRGRLPVAQVAQPVQPHARREAAIELCFRNRIGRCAGLRDAPGERAVIQCGEAGILGHRPSIAILLEDV